MNVCVFECMPYCPRGGGGGGEEEVVSFGVGEGWRFLRRKDNEQDKTIYCFYVKQDDVQF